MWLSSSNVPSAGVFPAAEAEPFPLSGYDPTHWYSVTMSVQTIDGRRCSITQHQRHRETFWKQESETSADVQTSLSNQSCTISCCYMFVSCFHWDYISSGSHLSSPLYISLCCNRDVRDHIRSDTMISRFTAGMNTQELKPGIWQECFPQIVSPLPGRNPGGAGCSWPLRASGFFYWNTKMHFQNLNQEPRPLSWFLKPRDRETWHLSR